MGGGTALQSIGVCVWALADPASVTAAAKEIEKALRQALGATDPTRHRVTVEAGFIEHEDRVALWHTNGAPLPTADEARSYATAIIGKVATALSPAHNPALADAIGPSELVPARMRPIDLLQVAANGADGWDHWLIRHRPQLPSSTVAGTSADVFGAALDVRIGPGGAVLGFLSRWRPVLDEHVEVALVPAPSQENEHEEPPLLYVLGGESTPQHYLAPYWPGEDSEDLTLTSASELSLVVGIYPYSTEDPTQYAAVVDGGSGDYRFDWGMLPLSDFESNALVEVGEGQVVEDRSTDPPTKLSIARIPPGSHIVLVNVVDTKTGGFQHHSEQVYVAEPSDADTGAPVA
jgi:hypothetical protein